MGLYENWLKIWSLLGFWTNCKRNSIGEALNPFLHNSYRTAGDVYCAPRYIASQGRMKGLRWMIC